MDNAVSKVILGTVQFGVDYGIANSSGKPSFSMVKEILSLAYERGIRMLDTAAAYGESEEVLGRALHELGLASEMRIVSKISPLPAGCSRETAVEMIDTCLTNSLKRLQIDQLEAVLFHRENEAHLLPELQKQAIAGGRAGRVGISIDSSAAVDIDLSGASCIQLPMNFFDHRFDAFALAAEKRDVSIYCRSVYLQGLAVMPEEKIPASLLDIVPFRRKLAELAGEAGMDIKELAFRYMLGQPGVAGVLTGVDTVEQMAENCAIAAKGALPDDLHRAVIAAVPLLPEELIRPSLWKR